MTKRSISRFYTAEQRKELPTAQEDFDNAEIRRRTANKYSKPHQGKREIARRLARMTGV